MKRRLIPMLAWLGALFIALFFSSCQPANVAAAPESKPEPATDLTLDGYWFQGKAEVTSYDLVQARYREEHPGSAVLVFVSEDFLTEKQVKNESYEDPASVKVLKANMLRKFPTGMYDYSIMTSVFSPADTRRFPHAIKVTMSAQDWCGQTFAQINRRNDQHQLQQFSYFEQEGDESLNINGKVWLEDEIWTRLRMDPANLPVGRVEMLPSLMTLRLLHLENKPLAATGELTDYTGSEMEGTQLRSYKLSYENPKRTLEIVFEAAAPYQIVGWTETSPGMFGAGELRTIAKRKTMVMNDYWSKHDLADSTLRKFLGL